MFLHDKKEKLRRGLDLDMLMIPYKSIILNKQTNGLNSLLNSPHVKTVSIDGNFEEVDLEPLKLCRNIEQLIIYHDAQSDIDLSSFGKRHFINNVQILLNDESDEIGDISILLPPTPFCKQLVVCPYTIDLIDHSVLRNWKDVFGFSIARNDRKKTYRKGIDLTSLNGCTGMRSLSLFGLEYLEDGIIIPELPNIEMFSIISSVPGKLLDFHPILKSHTLKEIRLGKREYEMLSTSTLKKQTENIGIHITEHESGGIVKIYLSYPNE